MARSPEDIALEIATIRIKAAKRRAHVMLKFFRADQLTFVCHPGKLPYFEVKL